MYDIKLFIYNYNIYFIIFAINNNLFYDKNSLYKKNDKINSF